MPTVPAKQEHLVPGRGKSQGLPLTALKPSGLCEPSLLGRARTCTTLEFDKDIGPLWARRNRIAGGVIHNDYDLAFLRGEQRSASAPVPSF